MNYSAGISSVLPLFYVGWSDSVLSPSEMNLIRSHVQNMTFLTESDKKTLIGWTNPKKPPLESDFKAWLNQFKSFSNQIDSNQNLNLVNLGIEMAKFYSNNSTIDWNSTEISNSITSLETALRIDSSFAKNTLLQNIHPKTVSNIEEKSNFDSSIIEKILDGKYHDIKKKTKTLISDKSFDVPTDCRNKEELRILILNQCKMLSEQGFGAFAYPTMYGGHDSPGGSTAIFETMALGNLSLLIKFGVQFGLFGGAIYQLGTKFHHDKYLEKTGNMEVVGCFAMTETGHGSNVKDLETTAIYNHESQTITINSPTISAGKEYIGNALHSKTAVVFVQLIVNKINHGIHAIIVPIRDENHVLLNGIKIEDCGYKIGLNGVDNGRIWFDNIQVPLENLLNKHGGIDQNGQYFSSIEKPSKRFFTMLGALVGGRVSVAAGSNSAAKKGLAIAIKYALKRRQFASTDDINETLIIDYPSHQERLFPLLAKSYAISFGIEKLREKFEINYGHSDQREVESLAAGIKSYASWHATKTLQTCREACGGKGYLSENELGDLKADTEIFTTFEGDNTVLMQLVAKALLTEFKQEFNEGGFLAIARNVMKRVENKLIIQNSFSTHNSNAEHILSQDFMASAFEFREEKLLFSLSDRMQSFIKKKISPNNIFLRVQSHMISLAHAHIEHFIYKEFALKINEMKDSNEKTALYIMLQIFSLNAIYENRAWFLENDFISGEKSKSIRKILANLYKQIRPNVNSYIKAFAISDELLKAKIAL